MIVQNVLVKKIFYVLVKKIESVKCKSRHLSQHILTRTDHMQF